MCVGFSAYGFGFLGFKIFGFLACPVALRVLGSAKGSLGVSFGLQGTCIQNASLSEAVSCEGLRARCAGMRTNSNIEGFRALRA